MFTNLFTLLVIVIAALYYYKKSKKRESQPTHYASLGSNGNPVQAQPAMPAIQRLNYFCLRNKGYHVSVWPKDQGIGNYLEFPIAGITHGQHVNEHLGETVATLKPEPNNPYDPQAIVIITREGHRVGYVPRDQTQHVRNFTTLPCTCYCYIGINNNTYFTDCYITRQN